MAKLKFFRRTVTAVAPHMATAGSACFDLRADLGLGREVDLFGVGLEGHRWHVQGGEGAFAGPVLRLAPLQRAKIPTGLSLDIPSGYSVRLHPRSGAALQRGLTLVNAEGVVDADYVEEVGVAVINLSGSEITVAHGERICQAELVRNEALDMEEILEAPARKTTRSGGFGSTGTQ